VAASGAEREYRPAFGTGKGCGGKVVMKIAKSSMIPFWMRSSRRLLIILPITIWMTILSYHPFIPSSTDAQAEQKDFVNNETFIYQIAPDKRGGKAYKLVYFVGVPIDVFWKFKTDFDNDFLEKNKYIQKHNYVSQNGNTVITEDKYTHGPDVSFRWQTTVFPEIYRMDFILLNPEQCRQEFHYGYIQLESTAEGTRVTQVAYFDFWGASLWTNYPWRGGMKEFLSYTAHWEQETILYLKGRYDRETRQ
jgi:hypothetical protein